MLEGIANGGSDKINYVFKVVLIGDSLTQGLFRDSRWGADLSEYTTSRTQYRASCNEIFIE